MAWSYGEKFHSIIPTAIKRERLWKYHLPSTLLKCDPFDISSTCRNQKRMLNKKCNMYSSSDQTKESWARGTTFTKFSSIIHTAERKGRKNDNGSSPHVYTHLKQHTKAYKITFNAQQSSFRGIRTWQLSGWFLPTTHMVVIVIHISRKRLDMVTASWFITGF